METTRYQIKEGDTEYTVAQQFKVSVGHLRDANRRFPAPYFQVGRKIFIPR